MTDGRDDTTFLLSFLPTLPRSLLATLHGIATNYTGSSFCLGQSSWSSLDCFGLAGGRAWCWVEKGVLVLGCCFYTLVWEVTLQLHYDTLHALQPGL
jgi:hypothetical protein